ncbi:ChaN family lipoprotein [Roseibacterium sp. SDUM158017]|uniref:ChaN family lipoprotein n=1 Tax=Roseicyclus salinarum TaxID=3036773 RepID=UPI0024150A93|nr:ChaN family lipoprotein [Roseibacterium sp. SDUM158017]MDG4647228.1 ChaN family lipoprotein [Roseibacterium sp. SDUM158017]
MTDDPARRRTRRAPLLLAAIALLPAQGSAERIDDALELSARAAGSDVVVLGEIHDSPAHHAFQAEAMAALGPTAIVFEMLTDEEAARVTPELAADAGALEAALAWGESGWPDFSMYYPLLAYGTTLPILGAEVPRARARQAFADGAATVFGGDAARFGLTRSLDPGEQALREAEQLEAHCNALPEDILPGFVEAQRLRDAMLADAALKALAAHGAPVVVVTGNGHARRDWGVPALLAEAEPGLSVLSLGQFEAEPEGEVPFDFWTVADPVEREDPCAAFR